MHTAKRLAFTVAMTLLIGLFCSAQAQVIADRGTKIQAIEVSPGIMDTDKGIMYGASFMGKTTGVFPGSFFLSMNYDMSSRLAVLIAPPQRVPFIQPITSGTWSLPVYNGKLYQGAIYGHVVEGSIQEAASRFTSSVRMTLIIDGGTQTYANASGTGTFSGTINRVTKDGKPAMSGTLFVDLPGIGNVALW